VFNATIVATEDISTITPQKIELLPTFTIRTLHNRDSHQTIFAIFFNKCLCNLY